LPVFDLEARRRKTLTPSSTTRAAITTPYKVSIETFVAVTVFVRVLTAKEGGIMDVSVE
jgi:hypothetical protein